MNNEAPEKGQDIDSQTPFQMPPPIKIKVFVYPNRAQGFTKNQLDVLIENGYLPWLESHQPEFCTHIYISFDALKHNLFTKNKIEAIDYKLFVYPDQGKDFTLQELNILFASDHTPWSFGTSPRWSNYTLLSLNELILMTTRKPQ